MAGAARLMVVMLVLVSGVSRADAPPQTPLADQTHSPTTVPAFTEDPAPTTEPSEDAPTTRPVEPPALRFFNLRYDEDFRYLDEFPELRDQEPRLWLKNLHAGDDWRVDF